MDACTSGIPLSASSVMYVTPDHFHVVVRRSRGYPEIIDGIIIYSERSGVCRLLQTHVNTTSTLYMLSSQVAACAPMNLNNQGNQQQPCLFWK